MAEVEERQKVKDDVAPVEQEHHEKNCGECRKLDVSPNKLAPATLAQFLPDCRGVIAEETKEDVAPRIFCFAVMAMLVNGNPASFLSIFILGAIFIWLPSNILTRLGKMNFESSTSSGSNMSVTPALAFRFFGWVIFSVPTALFLLSKLIL